MKSLGLYFGPRNIHLIEADGKKISKVIQFPVPKSETNILDDKASEDVKIAQMLSEQLRKNPVESKSVNMVIPGKDFIIRTFHMPVLPQNELHDAVRFEAKKYIPFKVEELAADFRTFFDKPNKKNLILFVGIKKDILAKYTAMAIESNLKVDSVEYAGFSAIRLLQQANIREKDTCAVVYADPAEDDEVNFVVLEDGFPLFSRDIVLSGYTDEGSVKIEKLALADKIEKLKIEVRVSLDYYLRKFPTRNIKKLIFVAPPEYRVELENFVKDRALASRFVELSGLVDRPGAFSLGFYKAYAASQTKAVVPKVKVDLLAVTMKTKTAHARPMAHALKMPRFNFSMKYVLWGLLLCGVVFGWGLYKRVPAERERDMAISSQPRVAGVAPSASIDEVNAKNAQYIERLRNIDSQLRKRLFLTEELDVIPQVIPEGVWFRDFAFTDKQNTVELVIYGWAYLEDSNRELEAINNFLTRLKENQKFSVVFRDIKMTSATQEKLDNTPVTSFVIMCKGTR
ncbi:MAG TPA: pilus assembly protein PilM [Candidatus Omnitrophota bacterium]|nr:pilus assembly protein PilM [Candidatus Omnitrophota bacterium]